jgi:hypothetical protein
MDGHELAVVLTAMPHEEHALLGDVTCRTDECVALEAANSLRSVRDHLRKDQIGAATTYNASLTTATNCDGTIARQYAVLR